MFFGADTEQVRQHAELTARGATRCRELARTVGDRVAAVAWTGPDADAFRDRVFADLLPQWDDLSDRVLQASEFLVEEAEQQDGASDGSDGGRSSDSREGGRSSDGVQTASPPVMNLSGDRGEGEGGPPLNPDGSIDGPEPYPGTGLGEGVPGTTAKVPDPPAWAPADEGSGEWNSREPTDADRETLSLTKDLIFGGRLTGKGAASDNLQHYIDNTGADKAIDVDAMRNEVPGFDTAVTEQRSAIGQEAIDQAQASGATGPVTFPVNTGWTGGSASQSESEKFYYATGSFDYSQNGTVTAYPPSTPGGEWTYEVSTTVNVRDRYNWDTGKGVTVDVPDWIPGYDDVIHIPDTQMQGLHQSGLAKEYNIVGQSEQSTQTGP